VFWLGGGVFQRSCQIGQPERVIKLAHHQKATVGTLHAPGGRNPPDLPAATPHRLGDP
jgi:hypothetical protein